MTKRMLIHDRRLQGNAPAIAQNTYVVDQGVSTAHIVGWVGTYAGSQRRLDELILMCHGFVSHADAYAMESSPKGIGAGGLQLGTEGLTLANVGLTRAWRGKIDRIYLYSCSSAMSAANGDPQLDGHRFCGELALHSGATVYAAEQTQRYHQLRTNWEDLTDQNMAGTIDFGAWEGPVYAFSPDSGRATRVTPGRAHRA
jgi:hypothetical protein